MLCQFTRHDIVTDSDGITRHGIMRFNLLISEMLNGKFKGRELESKFAYRQARCFTVIGGIRTRSMTINNETVDVTDKDGNGFAFVEGAGITSMSLKAQVLSLMILFLPDHIINSHGQYSCCTQN